MVTKKEKFLAAAQKFLEKGSLDKALPEFQKAAVEDPKDTRTWLRIAEILVKRGENEQAVQVYLNTADIYVEQGFFQRAVAVYKNILKLSPNYVEGHFKLADIYKQLGLLSDAVQQYELAAAVFQRSGRIRDAMGALKQIVDMSPDNVVSRIKLAEAASQAGDNAEAIKEFGRAGEQLLSQGRVDEYLRVAERLLFHQPENQVLAKEMAIKYIERNNARFALAKLQSCFKANPQDVDTLDLLARAFEQLGQIPKTISVLKELAKVQWDAGQTAERNKTINRILAIDPNDPDAREVASRQSFVAPVPKIPAISFGKRPAAITFSDMAVPQFLQNIESPRTGSVPPPLKTTAERVALASNLVAKNDEETAADVERIISEADVFVKYGLVERAADHLRKVFDLISEHVGARERLVAVLAQLGRTAEAVTELEVLADQLVGSRPGLASAFAQRALDLDPNSSRARKILESIAEGRSPDTDGGRNLVVPQTDSGIPELVLDMEITQEVDEGDSVENLVVEMEVSEPPPQVTTTATDLVAFDRVERTGSGLGPDEALLTDLEQVDFFLEQGLWDEATTLLDDLSSRYPRSPLLADRRERLQREKGTRPRTHSGAVPQGLRNSVSAPHAVGISPRAVLADGGTVDLSTHGDLGIAYKEMGLYDAALKEFIILAQDSKREVFALTMIGECHEAKGSPTEAVIHYKKALNRPQVGDAEATQLYYQLGSVFLGLGDRQEALYFFEKVVKREPNFRDAGKRVAELRGKGTPPPVPPSAGRPAAEPPLLNFDSVVTGSKR